MFESVVRISQSTSHDITELAGISGLNSKYFFRGANFDGVDIRGVDLSFYDLSKTTLSGAVADLKTNFDEGLQIDITTFVDVTDKFLDGVLGIFIEDGPEYFLKNVIVLYFLLGLQFPFHKGNVRLDREFKDFISWYRSGDVKSADDLMEHLDAPLRKYEQIGFVTTGGAALEVIKKVYQNSNVSMAMVRDKRVSKTQGKRITRNILHSRGRRIQSVFFWSEILGTKIFFDVFRFIKLLEELNDEGEVDNSRGRILSQIARNTVTDKFPKMIFR